MSFDAVVPLREAGRRLPGRVLMGNVSTYTLEMGDPARVKALACGCLRGGSKIISPACDLGMGSPLRNVQTLL